MRRVRTIAVTGLILSCALLLAGCNKENTVSAVTDESAINMSAEVDKQAERSSQSLWFVIDEKGDKLKNLSSDNPEVRAVNSVITKHSEVVDNYDYRNLKEAAEFSFYAQSFIDSLQKLSYSKALNNMYKDNKIAIGRKELAWYEMAFYKDMKKVRIKTESEIVIKDSSQNYLDKYKLKKNQVYSQPRIVDLQKENGVWKITRIDKGPYVAKTMAADAKKS